MKLFSSCISPLHGTLICSQGDHGFPFVGPWLTPVDNPHNEAYQMPFMIYNPLINNPQNQTVQGNFYGPAIPTTILDLMSYTKSFAQIAQRELADRFAANYEFAQSFLRPVKEAIRFFFVHPGGSQWVLDNGRNLRVNSSNNLADARPNSP
jgi:arylsulfatase A-like enzyme